MQLFNSNLKDRPVRLHSQYNCKKLVIDKNKAVLNPPNKITKIIHDLNEVYLLGAKTHENCKVL
jgi:hypothetical protein